MPISAKTTKSPWYLAAAVGNCLSESLLFSLRKFKQAPEPITCDITAEVGRNPEGRVRVLNIKAVLTLGVPAASLEHLDRVVSQFEAYCTVTQSVGQGIPITIEVFDSLRAEGQIRGIQRMVEEGLDQMVRNMETMLARMG